MSQVTTKLDKIIKELKNVASFTDTDFKQSRYYQDYVFNLCQELDKESAKIKDWVDKQGLKFEDTEKKPKNKKTQANRTKRPYESETNKSDNPQLLYDPQLLYESQNE